jgi:glycerol-3-phosphate acyltransferase PlsY
MPHPMSWSLSAPYFAAALLFGYALGSIPFGVLFTRLTGLGDIRAMGSGNIGATNVLRTGRKGLAAATLLGDGLKGTAAVLAMSRLWGPDAAVLAGLGAFLGHLFPFWLGFRGGKGVATYLGLLLAFSWPAALVFAAIWLGTAALTRYSSLSALLASLASPAALAGFGEWQAAQLFVLLTVLVYVKHLPNIRRLLAGTESRIGRKT